MIGDGLDQNLSLSRVNNGLKIAAVLKFSTLDYPGKLSTVVFCQGCPNRCIYCHNPDFQDASIESTISFEEFIAFLKKREDLLDAVVFSGGEPLIQPALCDAINVVKDMGFLAGIHTSGFCPDKMDDVLAIVDWVGFDIKTSFENYEKITKIPCSGVFAKKSFEKLVKSKVDFEIRTTVDSRHVLPEDLCEIAEFLKENNVKKWVLQECILRNNGDDLKMPLPDQETLLNISSYIELEIRKE